MDIPFANVAKVQKWNACYTDCDPRNPRNGYIGCVGCVGCEGSKVEYLLTWRDLCNPCNGYIRCNGCKGAKVVYFFFLPSNMPTISLAVSSSYRVVASILSLMQASLVKAVRYS